MKALAAIILLCMVTSIVAVLAFVQLVYQLLPWLIVGGLIMVATKAYSKRHTTVHPPRQVTVWPAVGHAPHQRIVAPPATERPGMWVWVPARFEPHPSPVIDGEVIDERNPNA
ncbi:hypothetical protein [Mycolicibacterium sp.]|uniref:hypothetical protein n=1 Tax=Mycolicibacterium sp. TaxID=2320850 RepID=UPI0037C793AA